jgi:hypothetical protein
MTGVMTHSSTSLESTFSELSTAATFSLEEFNDLTFKEHEKIPSSERE